MDIQEASEYMSIPVRTIREYIRTRDLPAYKVGKKLLFSRSELDNWIEQFRFIPPLREIVEHVVNRLDLSLF